MSVPREPTFHALDPPAEVPEARASATIIVVRDGADGPDVFMLERHIRSDFAGGAYVFPGGTVDPGDHDPALASLVEGWEDLARAMGEDDPDAARALIVCAIRETFEESGILLARNADGSPVRLDGPRWQEWRSAVDSGAMDARALAEAAGIRYAADLLRFWARWMTPLHSPRRYDTRFFIAHLPEGQEPLHDEVETTASTWVAPRAALAAAAEGRFTIIFPTRTTLRSLDGYASADALFAAARGRSTAPVLPRILVAGDQVRVQLPDDPVLHLP